MANSLDELHPRAALVMIACDFHARGWMAGTAGNLSAREDDNHFWITASGKPKGRLDERDFLLVRGRWRCRRAPARRGQALGRDHNPRRALPAVPRRAHLPARPYRRGHRRRRPCQEGREELAAAADRDDQGFRHLATEIRKWICRCSKMFSMSQKSRVKSKSGSVKPSPADRAHDPRPRPDGVGPECAGSLQSLRNPPSFCCVTPPPAELFSPAPTSAKVDA